MSRRARFPIRGVTSNGMLCSPRELAISADHEGILVLPADSPVGADFRAHFGLDDVVFDIEIMSNRADLQSVIGVAREAAVGTETPLRFPDATVQEGEEKATDAATVEILDLERCPRYLARVIRGVQSGPSPISVQARLTAAGMRPLGSVVDATNYVMLEVGQPMHPFDLSLLEAELERHGIDSLASRPSGIRGVVDPMVIEKAYDTYRKVCYRAAGCDPR